MIFMARTIRPGETIPLERFPEEIKQRARAIGQEALQLGLPMPRDIFDALESDPADLRTAQLCRKLTYRELDEWAEKQQRSL